MQLSHSYLTMNLRILILASLFFSINHLQAFANMANPVIEGSLGSRPFVAEHVDVLHEDLWIGIDEQFEMAQFEVKYHIQAEKDGFQIPFLFYASEYGGDFEVKVDGESVEVKEVPGELRVPDGTKFKDFSYFFEKDSVNYAEPYEYSYVLLETDPSGGFHVDFTNMVYFETDITEGKHTIEVSYRAEKWIGQWGWINEYSFRYALSPAKYWRSFGTLEITLDATGFSGGLRSNLGPPTTGDIDSLAVWKFDQLPVEILEIIYLPEISSTAKTLIGISPFGLAMILGVVLTLLHLLLVIYWRKRKPTQRFSLAVIIGSLIVPLAFFYMWGNGYGIIDSFIGEEATGFHGYAFLVVLNYPFVLLVYWLAFWLFDRWFKRRRMAG